MARFDRHDKTRFHNKTVRGEDLPQAKNTEADIILIRLLHKDGMRLRDIADKFELHHTTIWRIVNYLDWRHVK